MPGVLFAKGEGLFTLQFLALLIRFFFFFLVHRLLIKQE